MDRGERTEKVRTIQGRDEVRAFAEAHTPDHDGFALVCRWCGVAPVIKDKEQNCAGPYRVECPMCGIRTGESTSFGGVLAVWNRVMHP